VKKDGDLEVWSKQLQDGGRAVVLFNRGAAESKISVAWQDLGYPTHLTASVRDLWAHKDLGKISGKYEASVPSHGVLMIKVMP
jgi:alpha-galactosidase